MANYNKVILVGNLTRDPRLSYTANNTAVADFGLAVNRRWRGQDGQMKEEVMFIDCSVFGKSAETFSQYMAKGRPVLVEGRLQLQQWQTQDGQKRSKHAVVVENFRFMGPAGERGPGGGPPAPRAAQEPAAAAPADAAPSYDGPEPAGPTDDIPF
jgi:single-strand DNA-binding protein